ncbi:MAG: hypothetical protein ACK4PR_04285 [Gammaproteobacteria bacterium]
MLKRKQNYESNHQLNSPAIHPLAGSELIAAEVLQGLLYQREKQPALLFVEKVPLLDESGLQEKFQTVLAGLNSKASFLELEKVYDEIYENNFTVEKYGTYILSAAEKLADNRQSNKWTLLDLLYIFSLSHRPMFTENQFETLTELCLSKKPLAENNKKRRVNPMPPVINILEEVANDEKNELTEYSTESDDLKSDKSEESLKKQIAELHRSAMQPINEQSQGKNETNIFSSSILGASSAFLPLPRFRFLNNDSVAPYEHDFIHKP